MRTFDDMLSKQLKDDEFRKEYEAIQPEMDVIRAIVDARTSQNMTQKELAERTGINQADISKLENGTRNPSVNLLKRLADDDDKIRLNQRKPSKYKGLRRFGPEKNLQRINKFMKERPIFYKNLIQMKENIRFYLRCFYCITKVMILQFNSENRTELARNG